MFSESMMYSSASFLLAGMAFETSYTWMVAACNFAGAFRIRDDFYESREYSKRNKLAVDRL